MPTVLIIGSGFFGATVAERCASAYGCRVIILEKRDHIGGNSFSAPCPESGIEVHRYGSHIFHTHFPDVWSYAKRFTEFNDYRHTVWIRHRNRIYPMPVNLATINTFYGTAMSPPEARLLLDREIAATGITQPRNLEEMALSLIGRPLYEAFIRDYTLKQWGEDPTRLPADIIARLPVRLNYNLRYYNDPLQGIPAEGYGRMISRMLDHPAIEVRLNSDYLRLRSQLPAHDQLVYTGPIDRFFDCAFGPLGWRNVRFERQVLPTEDYQGTAVINMADPDAPFTRVHEYKHYTPERSFPGRTVVDHEYAGTSGPDEEPYYPMRTETDGRRLQQYQAEANRLMPRVHFGGRLGSYQYLDMDDAIAAGLACAECIRQSLKN
ncbi:MAG: UDP-galactopyranose mutase [Kiritimatiellia bacterium]